MKKILFLASALLVSTTSFADCRDIIQEDISKYKSNSKGLIKDAAILGGVLSPVLFYAAPPAGIFFTTIVGGIAINYKIQAKNRKKLIEAINDAYSYIETNKETSILRKIYRKVNRRSGEEVDMLTIVNALIDSNENGELCEQENGRNIRQVSRLIAVNLED